MMASPSLNISWQRQDAFLGLWCWKAAPGAVSQREHGWNPAVGCQQRQLSHPQARPGSDFALLQIGFETLPIPLWMRQFAIASPHLLAAYLPPRSGAWWHPMGTILSLCLLLLSMTPLPTIHMERESWSVPLMLTGSHGLLRGGGGKTVLDNNSWKGEVLRASRFSIFV